MTIQQLGKLKLAAQRCSVVVFCAAKFGYGWGFNGCFSLTMAMLQVPTDLAHFTRYLVVFHVYSLTQTLATAFHQARSVQMKTILSRVAQTCWKPQIMASINSRNSRVHSNNPHRPEIISVVSGIPRPVIGEAQGFLLSNADATQLQQPHRRLAFFSNCLGRPSPLSLSLGCDRHPLRSIGLIGATLPWKMAGIGLMRARFAITTPAISNPSQTSSMAHHSPDFPRTDDLSAGRG